MEAFSQLLGLFRLSAQIYNNAQLCGNWQVEAHELGQTCFHLVTTGCCRMQLPGGPEHILETGDLVLFPREVPHTLIPLEQQSGPMGLIRFDPSSQGTGLLCGTMLFEHRAFYQMLDQLPQVMIITHDRSPWLDPLLSQIHYESLNPGAGSDVVLNRLSELLFVYGLRQYLADQPELTFLSLYLNRELAPAIHNIHSQPSKQWTLEELAHDSAMSRTKFANLFKQISGWTPNEYITWWRMQLAYERLQLGEAISAVAAQVGYASDAAFSRAFKKVFNLNPGQIRHQQVAS